MTSYAANLGSSGMPRIVQEMEAIDSSLRTTLTELDEAARGSLAHWTKDAREAYNVAKAKWDAAAKQMPIQAKMAAEGLTHIHHAYGQGEKFGVDLWNG
ncbi:hypothetical protein ABZ845_21820 [Streptomyces sp. NPDC047022]|uniref:hypothetical protein n=1 Tax=Streptomyces sp. NPDC047022 TaxID=3155737 RepID=UPI0033D151C4